MLVTSGLLLKLSMWATHLLFKDLTSSVIPQNEVNYIDRETKIAFFILQYAEKEIDSTDGVKRAIGHLESAYFSCFTCLGNYKIKSKEKALKDLWDVNTKLNSICISLSILHYIIGNVEFSKFWLIEKLTDKGSIDIPDEIMQVLSIDKEVYLEKFGQDCYEKIKLLRMQSKTNWEKIAYSTSVDAPFFTSISLLGG